MTRDQITSHWRLWQRVCARHGWRMKRGRLQCNAAALNIFSSQVWEKAATIAAADARAATVDDLRHALYYLACGQVSSGRINPGWHTTRLFGWLRLCLDDADLSAARAACQTAAGHTAAVSGPIAIKALGFPDGYILAIARDLYAGKFTDPMWEDLPVEQLRSLYRLLRKREARNAERAVETNNKETKEQSGEQKVES